MCTGALHAVHLDVSGAVMAPRSVFVLPTEIEADILGDDERLAARRLIVAVARISRTLFADEPGRLVAQEGLDGDEAATDDEQIGLDDAGTRLVSHPGPKLAGGA